MTSATDELRRMLDGRRVEWTANESEIDHVTTWKANGGRAEFYESKTTNPDLLQVSYYHITPEQAVKATLGRGTCRMELEPGSDRLWWCSSCQAYHEHQSNYPWEFCPRCGAKVVGK